MNSMVTETGSLEHKTYVDIRLWARPTQYSKGFQPGSCPPPDSANQMDCNYTELNQVCLEQENSLNAGRRRTSTTE